MIIIVDGYNILKQVRGIHASESEKHAFTQKLDSYAQSKNHQIMLVFDGGYSMYPAKEQQGLVTIIHPGIHQSADDYIKKILEEMRGKDALLASSDNELCAFAYHRGIASIDALAFFNLLVSKDSVTTLKSDSMLKKSTTASESKELEEIMEQETRRMLIKKDDMIKKRERVQKVAKHEKKLLKKIKKL